MEGIPCSKERDWYITTYQNSFALYSAYELTKYKSVIIKLCNLKKHLKVFPNVVNRGKDRACV